MEFTICDSLSGGAQPGNPQTNSAAGVGKGLFAITLDIGPKIFTGADRWLEIGVRAKGSGGFTTLSPRQTPTPTDYTIFAASAEVGGGNAWLLNGTILYYSGRNVAIGSR